jgi:transketolase
METSPDAATETEIETLAVNTIRTLSIDAVEKANSGHPGTPMALAPAAYTLWQRFLRFDPEAPIWPNRDRFVLSVGHASMLLYSLIYLTGIKALGPDNEVTDRQAITLDDIKGFRQLHSKAAGHPEYRFATGVESTTGPLGQGVATSVGMAIASKWEAEHFNRPGFELFDYDVYVFCGDGDLMEGVSHEAASLAGHQELDNLCWLYDNNHITIDGSTELTYSDDVRERFEGYGWDVLHVADANDYELLADAFEGFRRNSERPTLIILDSHIGYGSPKQDTEAAHGEPLGEEAAKETKRFYGWPEDAQFLVPDGVREHFDEVFGTRGRKLRDEWESLLERYGSEHAELGAELATMRRNELPDGWDADIPAFEWGEKELATRKASNKVQNAIAGRIPWMLSGSADLTDSTSVRLTFEDVGGFEPGARGGRNLHLGIREHESAALSNGLALSNLRPTWSTYLVFSDYARPAIRLSAIMELPVIHIFTHDSVGLGEDGPTHQPIEHLASLRAIPELNVIRPCDANEVAQAWRTAMAHGHGPVALVLTRQNVPIIDRGRYASAEGASKGGYVLADAADGDPELILLATGSEVAHALAAHETLSGEGVRSRVVSMPSFHDFDRQSQEYRDSVLPPAITARVSVEAGSTFGWERYVGNRGAMLGMSTFGASAPFKDLMKEFGFTPERVTELAREVLEAHRGGEA